MPSYSFDNDGKFTNGTNVTIAANLDEVTYVIYNYSGSAVDLSIELATTLTTRNLVRSSGKTEVLAVSLDSFKMDADEVALIDLGKAGTTGAVTWRISEGETVHGLSAKSGTGHTSSYTEIAPMIYVAQYKDIKWKSTGRQLRRS